MPYKLSACISYTYCYFKMSLQVPFRDYPTLCRIGQLAVCHIHREGNRGKCATCCIPLSSQDLTSKCCGYFVLKTVLITISNIFELRRNALHIGERVVCVKFCRHFSLLRTLKKLQKATISFFIYVCPSGRNNLACHEILYMSIFKKSVKKIQVSS
jgi:hypothetical protein